MNNRSYFDESFEYYQVPEELKDALWNYLLFGFDPGGFLTSVLRNDFLLAMSRAHPMLTNRSLKDIAKWVNFFVPRDIRLTDENIYKWMSLTDSKRRDRLIEINLHPNEFEILRGKHKSVI